MRTRAVSRMQSNEASCVHLNAEIRLQSSCAPPASTLSHGGQNKGLWDRSYGRRGLELGVEVCAENQVTKELISA